MEDEIEEQEELGSLLTTLSKATFIMIDGNIKIEMMFKDNLNVKLRITAPKKIKIRRMKR